MEHSEIKAVVSRLDEADRGKLAEHAQKALELGISPHGIDAATLQVVIDAGLSEQNAAQAVDPEQTELVKALIELPIKKARQEISGLAKQEIELVQEYCEAFDASSLNKRDSNRLDAIKSAVEARISEIREQSTAASVA